MGSGPVLVGIFAWFEVVAVTLASVIFIGAAMLVGGVFQIVHAFMMRGWGSFLLSLIMGVLYVLGGLLIMDEPLAGSVAITLFLAVVLVVAGIMRIVMALQHRDMAGWGLMLASGIVTLLIGLTLYPDFAVVGLTGPRGL